MSEVYYKKKASKVYLKEKGFSFSKSALGNYNSAIMRVLDAAAEKAKAGNRKTVQAGDFE